MINKITDEIAEIRENISILPHTKKADKKKYTEYLAKNITDYKEKGEYIKEEIIMLLEDKKKNAMKLWMQLKKMI